jgi:hypothetical protein
VLSVFSRADEDIRREITQDVILDGFFTDPGRLTVIVKDGILTLAGAPGSVVLDRNIADQVRHVEGVVPSGTDSRTRPPLRQAWLPGILDDVCAEHGMQPHLVPRDPADPKAPPVRTWVVMSP